MELFGFLSDVSTIMNVSDTFQVAKDIKLVDVDEDYPCDYVVFFLKIIHFYLSLFNDLVLCNCMVDSRASNNIMSYGVMRQIGLKVTILYQNVYILNSREIEVWGLIKDLKVWLVSVGTQ